MREREKLLGVYGLGSRPRALRGMGKVIGFSDLMRLLLVVVVPSLGILKKLELFQTRGLLENCICIRFSWIVR